MTDKVNHPNHYKQGKYEAIDVINDIAQHYKGDVGYNIGNVLKYIIRAPHKHETPTEDLQKALKYLEFAMKLVTGEKQHNETVQNKELVNELLALKSEHETLQNEYGRLERVLSETAQRETKLIHAVGSIAYHTITPIGEINYEKSLDEVINIAKKALGIIDSTEYKDDEVNADLDLRS